MRGVSIYYWNNFFIYIFSIFKDDIERLKGVYDHVDDIDLFAAGVDERRDSSAMLGPIFRCIVADTFMRLKLGDR